jgi:hypothetical protein
MRASISLDQFHKRFYVVQLLRFTTLLPQSFIMVLSLCFFKTLAIILQYICNGFLVESNCHLLEVETFLVYVYMILNFF